MNTGIVIAAYNEEKNIANTVRDLKKHGYHDIVVVNDGSRDNTAQEALKAGATVLEHAVNRGQGASLQTGIDYALEQGADIVVTFDADGQHRAEDIPAMIAPVKKGEADVTFGSRFLGKKSDIPLTRKILLKGSVLVILLFYGVRMTDAHNGFRALSRKAAKTIRITADRMAHASEIIAEVHRKGLRYREVPVVIRYSKETLRHGQGSYWGAFRILYDMIVKRFLLR